MALKKKFMAFAFRVIPVMLQRERNLLMCSVGPSTPGGQMLRRYWHPVCPVSSAPTINGKMRIRILGEDLVLFSSGVGQWALVRESCLHRSASLYNGFVESGGIRCAYHGWLFDASGTCLERPFEPNAKKKLNVSLPAYPVRELGGLLFTYMGPRDTISPLPHWDILTRTDGIRYFEQQPELACNWVQIQENAADVTHTFFLHSYMLKQLGLPDESGFNRPLKKYGFQPFAYGVLKSWTYRGTPEATGWGNMLVFPNILRIPTEMHWRVPVDDFSTRIVWVTFSPENSSPKKYEGEVLVQPPRTTSSGAYTLDTFMSQDAMAVETQGTIVDRAQEVLGASDVGIIMFREMVLKAIEDVQEGGVPFAIVPREQAGKVIDLRQWMGGYLPMSCKPDSVEFKSFPYEEIFDERYVVVDVPDTPIHYSAL